jgi:hypothetical protein
MTPEEEARADRVTADLFAQMKRIGISLPLPDDGDKGDWSFLIRLHTMIEASLNHLITTYLGDVRLLPIITRLETGNTATGKLAFLSALNLLSSPCRSFIKHFSEIRNDLVHNVQNVEFDLSSYMQTMDKQRKRNLYAAIQGMIPDGHLDDLEPMLLFMVAFSSTMVFIYDTEKWIFQERGELSVEPPESSPKE